MRSPRQPTTQKCRNRFNIDARLIENNHVLIPSFFLLLLRGGCDHLGHDVIVIHDLDYVVVHLLKLRQLVFQLHHFVDEGRVVEHFDHELVSVLRVLVQDVFRAGHALVESSPVE